MSDTDLLIKRLRAAQAAIELALETLTIEAQRNEPFKVCPVCGDPLLPGDKIRRGVHRKCVELAVRRVRMGEWTQAQMDAVVRPPSPGGRKKKITPIDAMVAENPRNYVRDDEQPEKGKRAKRTGE